MAVDFKTFLQNQGTGVSSPVVAPQSRSFTYSTNQQQTTQPTDFWGGLKRNLVQSVSPYLQNPGKIVTEGIPKAVKAGVDYVKEGPVELGKQLVGSFQANKTADQLLEKTKSGQAIFEKNMQTANKLKAEGRTEEYQQYMRKITKPTGTGAEIDQFMQQTEENKKKTSLAGYKTATLLPGVRKAKVGQYMFGGLLGAGINILQGQDPFEGAGKGAVGVKASNMLLQGFNPVENALVNSTLQKISTNPLARQIVSRTLSGLFNVGEDEVLAKAAQQNPTGYDRLLSFGIGTLLNSSAGGDYRVGDLRKDLIKQWKTGGDFKSSFKLPPADQAIIDKFANQIRKGINQMAGMPKNLTPEQQVAWLNKQGGYIDMMGNIQDGTARTRDFDNARDILNSNDTKITPQQKLEAQNTIDQLGRQMFSKRKYRELTTGLNAGKENLMLAVADKIEADIKTNKGYEDIPNLKLQKQAGGVRVGEDQPFAQQPRQPIKTGEKITPEQILTKIDQGTSGLPGAELNKQELDVLGEYLKKSGDTSLRGKITEGPNKTRDVIFGVIKDRNYKGQTEYLVMADSGPYKGAFRLHSTPIDSKFFGTKIVGEAGGEGVLPKGAVISKDGTRYTYKGRSFPYLTGNETPTVKLTPEELVQANPLNEKLGFASQPSTKASPEMEPKPSKVGGEDQKLLTDKAQATPVNKIINALNEATDIRAEQEKMYTAERSQRFAKAELSGQKKGGGQAGYEAELGALKGPMKKAEFEGVGNKLVQSDIDSLFNNVNDSNLLTYPEKLAAKGGLAKLLQPEGGVVPTKSEIALLEQVFPKEFTQAILSKRSNWTKVTEGALEVINVPRALMASMDVSAPLRQGVFLIGRPKEWIPAFKEMFSYFASKDAYDNLLKQVESDPNYLQMKTADLALVKPTADMGKREEAFMSNLAEKIPILGKGVQASNRAYSGFLTKLRVDVFNSMLQQAKNEGVEINDKVLKDLGSFINMATGRGDLPKILKGASPILNSAFFSPRLAASRIRILSPSTYINPKTTPFVRKEALKTLLSFSAIMTTVLSLAKLAGADVETDLTSADAGKIKVKNTRYDILGGLQQYVRLAAQMFTGKITSSTTGVKMTLGEGYKPMTRGDILRRFIESKEAPVMTFVNGILNGTNPLGEKFDIKSEIAKRFIPLVLQDMYTLYKEEGLKGIPMSVPAFFGVGTQTYESTPKDIVRSANSVTKEIKNLRQQGDNEAAQKLIDRNKVVLSQAKGLDSYVTSLNKLESNIEKIKEDKRMNPDDKKKLLAKYEADRKRLEKQIDEVYKKIKKAKPGPALSP